MSVPVEHPIKDPSIAKDEQTINAIEVVNKRLNFIS